MNVDCACGAQNSAFNPTCVMCGAPIVEEGARSIRGAARGHITSLGDGARLGDYVVVRPLGSGSLGRVFLATGRGGEGVALKVLHPHLLAAADARVRFVREAKALRDVRHPHIGALLDAFEHDGLPVLVLEYVAGLSLRHHLDQRGAMPADGARIVLAQLTDALHALHQAGWVHRDVKPENVMLVSHDAPDLDVRLLDFGLARALAPSLSADARTAAGVFVGSIAYSAPEQLLSTEIGPAADWWSLGVVAYELLTHSRPFAGERRRAVVAQILAASPPPMRDAPPELEHAIRSLLVVDPTQRPTYAAIRDAWRSASS
jgi:serine/threonine protein kinase